MGMVAADQKGIETRLLDAKYCEHIHFELDGSDGGVLRVSQPPIQLQQV